MSTSLPWFEVVSLTKDSVALLGALLGAVLWRRLDRANRLMVPWLLIFGIMDAIIRRIGYVDLSERYLLVQFWFPMSAPVALSALGALQSTETRRDTFRLMGLGYVFVWAILLMRFEEIGQASRFNAQLHSLFLLAASAATLVTRTSRARGDLRHDPGFLLAAAMMVFAIPTLFLSYVARYRGNEQFNRFMGIQSIIAGICVLVMIYGMLLSVSRNRWGRTA